MDDFSLRRSRTYATVLIDVETRQRVDVLGVGIVATIGANVAQGLNHGTIGAVISAWPAVALVGSF